MLHEAPWQQDAQQGMEPGNKQDAIASSETESRRNPVIIASQSGSARKP